VLSRVLVEQLLEVFARQAARSALGIGVPAAEPAATPAPEPTIATLLYGYGGCGGSGGEDARTLVEQLAESREQAASLVGP
jgi:hypothetical protein